MRFAEPLTDVATFHGEGPFWDERTGRIMVMDVLANTIVAIELSGRYSRHRVPANVVTVIRRRTTGGFVITTGHDLMSTDDKLATFERISRFTDDPDLRTNDGGCDPSGAFVVGTMAYDERPGGGAVYRVTPNHQVIKLFAPVSISNGVQWSSDGERVYYIDTPTRRVDVFDVNPENGEWSNQRVHTDLANVVGYPDGMAIDDENGLWVGLWGGGAVNHYDPLGQLVETIEVPGVTQVSSCAFGGEDRDVLFITTSRQGLPDDREPAAGTVFAVRTESRGAAMSEFAG